MYSLSLIVKSVSSLLPKPILFASEVGETTPLPLWCAPDTLRTKRLELSQNRQILDRSSKLSDIESGAIQGIIECNTLLYPLNSLW